MLTARLGGEILTGRDFKVQDMVQNQSVSLVFPSNAVNAYKLHCEINYQY